MIHRNGDRLDNRRGYLCYLPNRRFQGHNRVLRTNTNGFKGVRYRQHVRKWGAEITVGGRTRSLGYFATAEAAARADDAAARAVPGDLARLNVPEEDQPNESD